MDFNNQKLRVGIISKLKEYNAYIDNELPDYIVVMLANQKTMIQISNDLQLFLGKNTGRFMEWLQKVISSPHLLDESREKSEERKDETISEGETDTPTKVVTLSDGSKRSNSEVIEVHVHDSQDDPLLSDNPMNRDTLSARKSVQSGRTERVKTDSTNGGQRSRLTLRKKATRAQPDSTHEDQDLRTLIAQRREERIKHHRSDDEVKRHCSDDERDSLDADSCGEKKVSTSLPTGLHSVVKIIKKPHRSDEGGSRILQRALLGLSHNKKFSRGEKHTARSKVNTELTKEAGQPRDGVGVSGGVARKIIRVKMEQLDKLLAPLKSPQKTTPIHTVSRVSSAESEEEVKEEVEVEESGDDSDLGDQVIIELERDEEEQELQDQLERAALAAVKSVLPMAARLGRKRMRTSVQDLREIISKNKISKTDSPRFIVTLDNKKPYNTDTGGDEHGRPVVDDEEEGIQEREEDGSASVVERCRFWPNCKNGDSCVYVHPTVACKLFPNCKYGKKCLYVHPQCKFDARCTRPDCTYLHTAPKHLSVKQNVVPVPSSPFFKPKFNSSFHYSRGSPSPSSQRFPSKSALTWKPNKSAHVSERTFAVSDDQTTSLLS